MFHRHQCSHPVYVSVADMQTNYLQIMLPLLLLLLLLLLLRVSFQHLEPSKRKEFLSKGYLFECFAFCSSLFPPANYKLQVIKMGRAKDVQMSHLRNEAKNCQLVISATNPARVGKCTQFALHIAGFTAHF